MLKKWIMISISLLLSLSLVACGNKTSTDGNGSAKEDKELVVAHWGGAMTDAYKKIFDAFEEKYGVKVTVVTPNDAGKFKAMVESRAVEWDVANFDSIFALRSAKEGLLEKLDYNVINSEGVPEELVNEYSIGSEFISLAISYNTKKYPEGTHPKNWAEFWDTKGFPGPRTLWKFPPGLLESALLADGVKPEELYPLDVDRAFESLDKIKEDVKVWYTTGTQAPQLLANGEVNLAAGWSGRISTAKSQGAPEDLEFNQGIIIDDSWVVPKGAPNKDLAMKFIAFTLDPKQQAAFSSTIDYSPANAKALDLLDPEVRERLGQNEENAKQQILLNNEWWVENYDKVNERFEQWLLK
ncbi:ABC transporter substrate-binding protein [Peribacillus cavernae]|uniref:ABC transporter substrate-binding protein n=1 Tax=Peribacillus cavernae TaxID=1674310 RepID=UPI001FEAA807|nr:ABC transporter substrate-binding protein [Peribacillus cavernae]MDQ0219857.1 putative spermidine/putrescine transport system substrate-binding protein [Peribacillus cavernae]